MKTTTILIGCLLVMFTACESHGPLKGVWKEANESLLACVTFHHEVDTLNLSNCLPGNSCPDSVFAPGFTASPMKQGSCIYRLIQKKTKRNLHPIRIWKDGESIILMTIDQASIDSLAPKDLKVKGMLNNRLLLDCSGRPSELYVLWQNVELPKSFFVFTKEGFATLIPKEAKSMERSVLRIFSVNDSLLILDNRVTLNYGVPEF